MKLSIPAALLLAFLLILNLPKSFSQDSVITKMAKANVSYFTPEKGSFTGLGWQNLMNEVKSSNNILIGEDHFTNEIPYFTAALAAQTKFENFFAEIDPYTANVLQTKIKTLSQNQLQDYVKTFGNTFSFYAFAPEFSLLKQLSKANTKIQGTDQILLVGDRVLAQELMLVSKNNKAKQYYKAISDSSKLYFDKFLKDQSKPFYFLTDDFDRKTSELLQLPLSAKEKEVISAMKLSVKIYKSQNHQLRIQLMKNQLMHSYNQWVGKKNLFKYGANHMTKGESLLEIFDIGNLVNNIDDSNYQQSLHIMIMGASGEHASPFEGHAAEKIVENTGILKTLSPITIAADGKQWNCFDLRPLKKALVDGKLEVKSVKLSRIIKGYDFLVMIPKVSAAPFAKN